MSANRAARRRVLKAAQKDPVPEGYIRLANPVAQHFEAFVVGNAEQCQRIPPHTPAVRTPEVNARLQAIVAEHGPIAFADRDHPCRDEIAPLLGGCWVDPHPDCVRVVEPGTGQGQHLVLCGAGPSLAEHAAEWVPRADQLWGCNSALTWLVDQGYTPTHGITVDQTPAMLQEWVTAPDVEYLLASTVHPHLTEWLIQKGRRTRFFHNYVGIKGKPVSHDGQTMGYEDWLYSVLFPGTIRAGSGLNSVNRAVDVALFMEFDQITVLGADCALRASKPCPSGAQPGTPDHTAWLKTVQMHADGGHALASGATAITLEGEIDGRRWLTKPDMMISAQWLARQAETHPQIRLAGDTLPAALLGKTAAYLDLLPNLIGADGRPLVYRPWLA